MFELLMALREHGDKIMLAADLFEQFEVEKKVKVKYQEWKEKAEYEKLWKSVFTLREQKDYEQAISLLEQIAQKFPSSKAVSLYVSALCYVDLHNYNKALRACKDALHFTSDTKFIQEISDLKTKIESIRSNFGFGFWLQWLVATVIVGAISFIGTIGLLGEQTASSSAGFLGFLSVGISISLAQWLLVRMRISTGIGSLLINIVITLVLLILSLMLLTVNVWLGLLAFVGCNMISTKWSIGRLQEQAV